MTVWYCKSLSKTSLCDVWLWCDITKENGKLVLSILSYFFKNDHLVLSWVHTVFHSQTTYSLIWYQEIRVWYPSLFKFLCYTIYRIWDSWMMMTRWKKCKCFVTNDSVQQHLHMCWLIIGYIHLHLPHYSQSTIPKFCTFHRIWLKCRIINRAMNQ